MTPVTTFAGRRVALFGLGGSGLATALALKAGGAEIVAFDDGETGREKARGQGIQVADLRGEDWSTFAALVLSPGVPLTHPAPHWTVELAGRAGVEVIGDIELFCRERTALAPLSPFVAITGTNGKSTTTALVAHMLREAGLDVQMGGNIGTAILSLAPPSRDRVHVIEMSSFQIDLTPSLAPSIGVLMNVSPDHLDRHGTIEAYAGIKARLVAKAETAIVGIDDPPSRAIHDTIVEAGGKVRAVSADVPPGEGWRFEGSRLFAIGRAGEAMEVADLSTIGSLRGAHNAQNAAVALAVGEALGIERATLVGALATFPGLAHRMEEVGRRGTTLFVNDSKATNADSAEKALTSFARIYWIAGGKPKEGGIRPLRPHFSRIAKAYLIGEAAADFAETLGEVPHVLSGTLERAVAEAAADAERDDGDERVVLLSPACASYDQFRNFEIRGDRFRELVGGLPGIVTRPAHG